MTILSGKYIGLAGARHFGVVGKVRREYVQSAIAIEIARHRNEHRAQSLPTLIGVSSVREQARRLVDVNPSVMLRASLRCTHHQHFAGLAAHRGAELVAVTLTRKFQ